MSCECGRRRLVWDVFWAALILFGIWEAVTIWKGALKEPAIVGGDAASEYGHAWKIDGVVRYAASATSSAPDYMGSRGYSVTGYDRDGNVIWTVSGVTSHEKIR